MSREWSFGNGLLVVFLIGIVGWLVSSKFQVSPNWEDALILTLVLFSSLAISLRPAWSNPLLWRDLTVAFVLHALILAAIVEIFIANSMKIKGFERTIVVVVEGIIILSILWRRNISER